MRTTPLTAAAGASLMFGLLAAGAPGVKDKVEPDKPETEDMYPVTTLNLRRIALGWHNYEAVYGKFPGNVATDGKELLSWRVQILPYIEGEDCAELFKAF